ncbi:RAMP superfamily CRISPR-associated protein [Almyronema epifaneia]|uniref:RAMP superfamily CRISPR-associated protein n=1 Tax=Almyronema epifaneia S1 TaxID=2991925 RepID=A0ABW6IKA6_9CYAN
MSRFRLGYLYALSPIHPGGEGDLGNILDIVRETHTNFPYIPGSSLRGCLRDEVRYCGLLKADAITNRLFGDELDTSTGKMGVHQAWFGDARLLWVPMRTMELEGKGDVFTWVSCHTLIRDHALLSGQGHSLPELPDTPVGTRTGTYWVADSQITVGAMPHGLSEATALPKWATSLDGEVKSTWDDCRIILSDDDFDVLMEHALWTQIRNKITAEEDANGKNQPGSAEVFWTDICIPRDTLLYFAWGYRKDKPILESDHDALMSVVNALFQVGGQANVGRGWVQGWVANDQPPENLKDPVETLESDSSNAEIPTLTGAEV